MPTSRRYGGTRLMSSPPSSMTPSSCVVQPSIIRSIAVFPEPDGPSTVTNSPLSIARSTPTTALAPPKFLARPRRGADVDDHEWDRERCVRQDEPREAARQFEARVEREEADRDDHDGHDQRREDQGIGNPLARKSTPDEAERSDRAEDRGEDGN